MPADATVQRRVQESETGRQITRLDCLLAITRLLNDIHTGQR